jgi:hypothetical protein
VSELQWFTCAACKRRFESTPEDVRAAAGHLCLAMDRGLSQHQALEEMAVEAGD